jgi:hypothetical protein
MGVEAPAPLMERGCQRLWHRLPKPASVGPGCAGVMGGTHPATTAGALVTGVAESCRASCWCNWCDQVPDYRQRLRFRPNMRSGDYKFGGIGTYLYAWNQVWRRRPASR